MGIPLHRGFEPEDIDRLNNAAAWLERMADQACTCQDCDGHKTANPCESCQARHALHLIEQVIEPQMVSLQPERMKNHAERLFVEQWRYECKRRIGTNHGFGALEWILTPAGQQRPGHVSQRDAVVATSVIQWLGTGCGGGFLRTVERKIEQERAMRSDWHVAGPLSQSPEGFEEERADGLLSKVAQNVAADYVATDKHPDAARCLARAIVEVALQYHKHELKKLLAKDKATP